MSAAGQPAPNDLSLAWVREDLLKAQGNKEYVPFTVSIDPSKVSGGNVALYWRVVSKSGGGGAGRRARRGRRTTRKTTTRTSKTDYAYEDISFVPVTAGQHADADQPLVHGARRRLRRVRRRQGADAGEGEEERAGAEDVG